MRICRRAAVVTAIALLLVAPGAAATVEGGMTFRIAGDRLFPPYEYVTASGSFMGFNVDLMHAIAIELGLNVELVPMSWSEARAALDSGSVDALQGMKYSEERDMSYDFSAPYLTSSLSIFVRSDNHHVSSLQDLRGMRVAVQSGDVGHEMMLRMPDARVTAFHTQLDALEAVANGSIDAFVGNRLAGIYNVQRTMNTSDIKMVGGEIDPQPYAMAFRSGETDKVAMFNRGLAAVRASGLYDKIYAKWFGEAIQPASAFIMARLRTLLWVAGATVALSAAVLIWNELLRREVAKRIAENARVNELKDEVLRSSFHGVAAVSPDMNVVWANPMAAQLLEAHVDDLIGHSLHLTPLGALLSEEAVRGVLEHPEVSREVEGRVLVGSEERTFSFRIGPIATARSDASPSAVLISFNDVTLARKAEEIEATQHKMEALARTISGIAHEVRNPLTAIATFAELLPAKYESMEFREEISRCVPAEIRRVNSIITDLLNFARPRRPLRQSFDLAQLLDSVVSLMRYDAEAHGVTIMENPASGRAEAREAMEATVWADPDQIRQVIINVLINAVQACNGGGRVELMLAACRADHVELVISDNGAGICHDDLQRVMEPFFSSKPGGAGMGLAVSYKLMQENGGDLSIRSELGRGTEVTLTVPRMVGSCR